VTTTFPESRRSSRSAGSRVTRAADCQRLDQAAAERHDFRLVDLYYAAVDWPTRRRGAPRVHGSPRATPVRGRCREALEAARQQPRVAAGRHGPGPALAAVEGLLKVLWTQNMLMLWFCGGTCVPLGR